MRFSGVIAAIWLWAGPVAMAQGVTAADADLTQANAALASGQYQAAITLATAGLAEPALEEHLKSRLLVSRGLAQQALGADDVGVLDFTVALQGGVLQGEERARALFARGVSLDTQGRIEAALGDYNAVLRISPWAPYALNNRANVYRRQGRLTEAQQDYVAAIEANTPNPQYPYYGLGKVAEVKGDAQAARDFYSRALTADPGFVLAREALQALGAPVEGPAGLPANPGVIVLKPPPRGPAPVFLRPPPPKGELAETAQEMAAPVPAAVAPATLVQVFGPRHAALVPAPGRGAPLRPAIVESTGSHGSLVQLGAWRSDEEARQGWSRAQAGAGGMLDGIAPIIVTAVLPGRGTFYRLRVAARGSATAICRALADRGLACVPVRD